MISSSVTTKPCRGGPSVAAPRYASNDPSPSLNPSAFIKGRHGGLPYKRITGLQRASQEAIPTLHRTHASFCCYAACTRRWQTPLETILRPLAALCETTSWLCTPQPEPPQT